MTIVTASVFVSGDVIMSSQFVCAVRIGTTIS